MNLRTAACGEDAEPLPAAAAAASDVPGRSASRKKNQPPPQLQPVQPAPGDREGGARISPIDVGMWPSDSDKAPGARYRRSLSGSITNQRPRLRLWLVTLTSGCLASFVIFVTVATVVAVSVRGSSSRWHGVMTEVIVRYGFVTVVVGIAAVTIILLGSTSHSQIVAALLFFIWSQIWSRFARWGLGGDGQLREDVVQFLYGCYTVSWAFASILACYGVRVRTKALLARSRAKIPRFMGMSFSTISLLVLAASLGLYGLSVFFCNTYFDKTYLDPSNVEVWQLPLLISLSIVASSYLAFAGISCHVFFRAWRVAIGVAAVAKGRLKDDARQAMRTAFFQLVGTCLSFLTTLVTAGAYITTRVLLLQHHVPFFGALAEWEHKLALVDALANVLLALALAGVFSGSLIGAFVRERQEFQRRLLHSSKAATAMLSENPEWNNTLEQLANRGFTLQALLDFYKGLGKDYMLHYDSECHTTLDVVRQAIIPLSSDKCVAYASLMMKGEPTRPEKMVTHGWGNIFRDLAAAVISDALCESEYAMIAYMMDHDIASLERWIHGLGKQSATYWVCAFSVNQHATICGQNFGDCRDSVTDELHPTCSCRSQKILNDTPPCFDGRSIHCEVNKFDDFMALMASSSASFQQVVAVDAQFTLFSRAWCVAELGVAAKMGMRQTVKVHSRHSLELSLEQLKTLRIEAMHASRKEDKAEILSKIPDKEKFNKELRSLLLERLFPSWHSLDPTDQMLRMSSMGRWYDVSKTMQLDGIWEAGASLTPRSVASSGASGAAVAADA